MELNVIENQFPLNLSDDQSGQICIRHDFDKLAYALSNLGQKILYEVMTKLNSRESGDTQAVKLDAAELDKIGIGFGKTYIYKNFSDACDEVQSLRLTILGTDDRYDYRGTIPLFKASLTKFYKNTNSIAEAYFAISEEASPYLTALTKEMRFNTVLAKQIRLLKRAHSMRLYQWLRKAHWVTIKRESTEDVEVSVDDIMLTLDFGRSAKDWREFKRRILDMAVKEVNEKSDIRCEYKIGQRGKSGKINTVVFSIQNASTFQPIDDPEAKKVEGDLVPSFSDGILEPERFKSVMEIIRTQLPIITDDELIIISHNYSVEIVLDSLLDLMRAMSSGSIRNDNLSYFMGILKNKRREEKATELESQRPNMSTIEKLNDRSWDDGQELEDNNGSSMEYCD